MGEEPTEIALDLNGDGHCDIVLRQPSTGTFYFRIGDGNGNFTEIGPHCWTKDSEGGPYRPLAGDFNGDGFWDIGVYESRTGKFHLKVGDGKGSFSHWAVHAWTADGNGGPYQPFALDLDGNGLWDIGLRQPSTGTLYFRLGDGKGNFAEIGSHCWTPDSAGGPYQIIAGAFDLNRKGDIALWQLSTGTFYFRMDHGIANFTEIGSHCWTKDSEGGPYRPLAGDFNGDGIVDIGVYESKTGAVHSKVGDEKGAVSHSARHNWTEDANGGEARIRSKSKEGGVLA